jgi:thiol-disulfide isomerase/thioredoxin
MFGYIGSEPGVGQARQGATLTSAPDQSAYTLIPSSSRKVAPDFQITDVNGRQLTLSGYRGRVVLLDFWAVDCGGCKIEIPWYVEFDVKYRDQGLSLIGLDMYGESPALIKAFTSTSQMKYPVAVGNDTIGKAFHAESLPMTLLIDRQGRIALSHTGVVDKAMFERAIQELLR